MKHARRLLTLSLILALLTPAAGGDGMIAPKDLPAIENLPDLMTFVDGTPVETPDDWERRREELLDLYGRYVYGFMPDPKGESVSYALSVEPVTGSTLLTVTVEANGRSGEIAALITLPEGEAPAGGRPFFLEYAPWHYRDWVTKAEVTAVSPNCRMAAARGYAGVQYDPSSASSDNSFRTGAFFKLYPYTERGNPDAPRGVLLAWAWGVSKIIDALEAGAGKELGIDPSLSIVGGVSRWGKSAAVAGAYDRRIRVTVPSCSGQGGTAVFRTSNAGKTYDLSSLGGPSDWVNTSVNEPLANLKGGEGYWFCGGFAGIAAAENLPVDQHMLCALAAGPGRHLIVVTGITSEGWNNTEGQCLAWRASQPVWDLLGIGSHNNMLIHLDGHAILPSDMDAILDYCDRWLLGREDVSPVPMDGALFLRSNRDRLDPAFAPYLD
ncbi:MAG: hypothetical protein IKP10_06360 [Clostridia bacterium]|nr:hypothetical protein [Clostridia bacterium]